MENIHQVLTGLTGPARFYFVRHGESEGNTRGKMQGLHDSPLTETGRQQASQTAGWFHRSGITVDRLFASPLVRAAETASIISGVADLPEPEALESAVELETGIFTDYSFGEIKENFPDEYAEFVVGSWEAVPGAERVDSLIHRGLQTWRVMAEAANGVHREAENGEPATIMTVTHGGMLQWILKVSFGAVAGSGVPWMPLILASNAAVFAFDARPVHSRNRAGETLRWYYGQWSLINYVPGPEAGPAAVVPEQFHTGGDQAR
jgi:broad specificity phosphatase PhoE